MLARFKGNVVPFANDSTSTNRTVFGGTTQSDTLDDNLNADFKKGWEIVGLNNNPTREDFNAMGYTLGALTSYLYQMGIAEYNALQEYKLNGLCLGTDGTIYQSLVDSNIGNALTNGTKWKNVTSSFVDLVNNQSIDGIKTFVKSPIVPTPTTGTQAANKIYTDTKVTKVTSTDNAIAKFNGTTGELQDSGVFIDDSGNLLLTSVTGALGYGAGAGGTVTQLTSKSTAVTLNKPNGVITMHNEALEPGASVRFVVNNNLSGDGVVIVQGSYIYHYPGNYRIEAIYKNYNSFEVRVTNISNITQSGNLVIKFMFINGSAI